MSLVAVWKRWCNNHRFQLDKLNNFLQRANRGFHSSVPSPELCTKGGALSFEQIEREARQSYEARRAYADYLMSFNWDYFVTTTFRKPWRDTIHAKDSVWSVLHGECFAKRAFVAVERHRTSPLDCHVHAIVSDYGEWKPDLLLPWDIWERLFHKFGRSEVSPVRSSEDVASYCSKYVVKRVSDYGFYGSPTFWER